MKECPTDPKHNRFIATAHVTEDWVVNSNGNFLELAIETDCQVLHAPDEQDIWTCAICETEAK